MFMPVRVRFLEFACAALLAFACVSAPARAADGGTVQGTVTAGAAKYDLKFARADLHDNAESLLQTNGPELRILLTDVEVGAAAINGIAFLPVTSDAREGKVHGLLITMKPDDPNHVLVTLLAAPADPGETLVTATLSSSPDPVIAGYKMDRKTVSGTIKLSGGRFSSAAISFSAAVLPEPAITADLKGKAAVDSAQVKSLRARAQAMVKGDSAGVAKLSTSAENRQLEIAVAQIGPQASQMMREAGRNILPTLATVERVVVRGDHAVVIFKDKESWQDMSLADGQWKTGK
jgi:hypothetical protein